MFEPNKRLKHDKYKLQHFRFKSLRAIIALLEKHDYGIDEEEFGADLEHGCYNAMIDSVGKNIYATDYDNIIHDTYNVFVNRIMQLIKSIKFVSIIDFINEGAYIAEDVARLDLLELFPDDYKHIRMRFEEVDRVQYKENVLYRCHKCGSNRIMIKDLQMRSGDEGCTTFYKCENGHQWQQS